MYLSRDTTPEAARVQIAALRRLSPAQKIRAGVALSDGVRRRIEIGVRERHPTFSEDAVQREVVRIMLGDELYRQVTSTGDAVA